MLKANSVVTQTLSGTPTVLPLWYCGPSETAAACKGCPSATTTGLPACTSGFQGLYLVPIGLPIVGGIIPPPAGLPTLTIGPDGNPTAKTTDQPPTEVPTTVLTTTTTTTEPWSVDAACKSPVLKAADHALDPLPQITSPPSPPPPNPAKSDSPTPSDLPVPMLPVEDPKNPQWWLGCGPFAVDPYFKNTFYQFGASFSKADAYNVIDQFCKENVERKRVIGKAGNHPVDKPDLKALPYVEKSYDTPGGSGKLQVRIQVDTDNKNRQGEKCPIDDVFSFEGGKLYVSCSCFPRAKPTATMLTCIFLAQMAHTEIAGRFLAKPLSSAIKTITRRTMTSRGASGPGCDLT